MDCIVCYEKTENQTKCNHFVCKMCLDNFSKQECPYCRQEIEIWKEVKFPFYYFVKLFNDHYRKNPIYEKLKVGIEYNGIFCSDIYYVFDEKYANCSWTNNYNQAVKLRIYNIIKSKKFTRIEFNTLGLDSVRNRYFFNFYNDFVEMDPYLKKWTEKNLN